jgi:hypothetical protein
VSFIQPQELELLPHPFFIVTEGMSDARLVDKLLQLKRIANCSVGCPSAKSSKGTGKDAFPNYLAVVQIAKGRRNPPSYRDSLLSRTQIQMRLPLLGPLRLRWRPQASRLLRGPLASRGTLSGWRFTCYRGREEPGLWRMSFSRQP